MPRFRRAIQHILLLLYRHTDIERTTTVLRREPEQTRQYSEQREVVCMPDPIQLHS